jgi:hypothetical protein
MEVPGAAATEHFPLWPLFTINGLASLPKGVRGIYAGITTTSHLYCRYKFNHTIRKNKGKRF